MCRHVGAEERVLLVPLARDPVPTAVCSSARRLSRTERGRSARDGQHHRAPGRHSRHQVRERERVWECGCYFRACNFCACDSTHMSLFCLVCMHERFRFWCVLVYLCNSWCHLTAFGRYFRTLCVQRGWVSLLSDLWNYLNRIPIMHPNSGYNLKKKKKLLDAGRKMESKAGM